MPLSKKKQEKVEFDRRQKEVNQRSLNGKGYFMDAGVEGDVKRYLDSGLQSDLDKLPDYRKIRQEKK